MNTDPQSLVKCDGDGNLTDDAVIELNDLRQLLRDTIFKWERPASLGDTPPAEEFKQVCKKLYEVDDILNGSSSDPVYVAECRQWDSIIRSIWALIQANTTSMTGGAATAPSTPVVAPQLNLPTFWPEQPSSWFTTVESEFTTHGIVDEQSQLKRALCKLPPEVAAKVAHVTSKQFEVGDYAVFKAALLSLYLKPKSERWQELIMKAVEPPSIKPSQVLLEMRQLAYAPNQKDRIEMPEELWKLHFSNTLPKEIRAGVGTASKGMSIDQMAEEADKYYEGLSRHSQVASIHEKQNSADATHFEGELNLTICKSKAK